VGLLFGIGLHLDIRIFPSSEPAPTFTAGSLALRSLRALRLHCDYNQRVSTAQSKEAYVARRQLAYTIQYYENAVLNEWKTTYICSVQTQRKGIPTYEVR
jgi:hypothetical protein